MYSDERAKCRHAIAPAMGCPARLGQLLIKIEG